MAILEEISENLQKGKAKIVVSLVQQAISEGHSAKDILDNGLLAGMSIIGGKFKRNEVYVPEVLIAARAMNNGAAVLKPLLKSEGVQAAGKIVLGTVQGDLHDIGKNLVRMMMEGKGIEVVDIGTDVPAEKFVETVKAEGAHVVACSALLTTTMGAIKDVIAAFDKAGMRKDVTIMIGGAPVTQAYCDEIGADAYAPDAASAAEKAVTFFQ